MGRYQPYIAELLLVGATMIVGLLGFWSLYVGPDARPQPHHHLHLATTYAWLVLLLAQILLLARGGRAQHRKLGLAVLIAGPLLVASAAYLTVHSAHRAIEANEPDALIVQNVAGTMWLALTLFLAFARRKKRKVHGALLTSTLILFLGPALFFALITWAPPFRIEGPETFYRFQTAGMTGQGIILLTALLLFLRDRRNNWPYLFAAASYPLAEGAKALLTTTDLVVPLTRAVAAPNVLATFALAFAGTAMLLAATMRPLAKSAVVGRAATSDPDVELTA